MIRKIAHYTDYMLTQELARNRLSDDKVVVSWYTNKSNKQSVVHSHPYYECILPMNGNVLYSCNGDVYHLREGELIIFPDEIFHSGKYDLGSETSERLLMQVDEALWHEIATMLDKTDVLCRKEVTVLSEEAVTRWDIKGLFKRISLTAAMNPEYRDRMFSAQLTGFMLILCQLLEDNKVEKPNATSTLVDKAVKYIQANFNDPELSVAKLADYAFVSRGHLSRVFKEYTMESVHGYLTNLRMHHCRLAIAEGKSVLDACTESGFSDYSSFLKTFRKLYGITPMEYKKRISKGEVAVVEMEII